MIFFLQNYSTLSIDNFSSCMKKKKNAQILYALLNFSFLKTSSRQFEMEQAKILLLSKL